MSRRGSCGVRLGMMRQLPGRDSGICEPAVFKAWKPREIARLGRQHVSDSEVAASIVAEITGVDYAVKEHIIVLGLDTRNMVVAVADGSSTERSVCLFLMQDALRALFASLPKNKRMTAMVMGHNHPGGDPTPSQDDIRTTSRMTCSYPGLTILDHVIAAPVGNYSSLRELRPELFPVSTCR